MGKGDQQIATHFALFSSFFPFCSDLSSLTSFLISLIADFLSFIYGNKEQKVRQDIKWQRHEFISCTNQSSNSHTRAPIMSILLSWAPYCLNMYVSRFLLIMGLSNHGLLMYTMVIHDLKEFIIGPNNSGTNNPADFFHLPRSHTIRSSRIGGHRLLGDRKGFQGVHKDLQWIVTYCHHLFDSFFTNL